MILSRFTLVSGVATTTPPSTSLSLQNYPDVAGSAAPLLGLARFALGGLSPLVGVAGAHTAVPLGLVALGATALPRSRLHVDAATASSVMTRTNQLVALCGSVRPCAPVVPTLNAGLAAAELSSGLTGLKGPDGEPTLIPGIGGSHGGAASADGIRAFASRRSDSRCGLAPLERQKHPCCR